MTADRALRLRAVATVEKGHPLDAGDIYAADRAKALDLDRWRRLHERDRHAEAIFLPDRPRCHVMGILTVEKRQ